MSQLRMIWRWWAKSLGQKASDCDKESDKVAIIRTLIFATYLITNAFIVAGVVRHWNDREINVEVEIYETPNNSEILRTIWEWVETPELRAYIAQAQSKTALENLNERPKRAPRDS